MAPQKCTVCSHSKTKKIEELIVQGKPNTQIADKFGLDHQAVRNHRMKHLPEKLVRSVQKKKKAHAESILDGINDLLQRTKSILDTAEEKNQKSLALKAIKEARNTYELLSKIAVKLREYQQEAQEKQEGYINHHIKKGLKTLTDKELELFIQLSAKIHAADENYMMDPKVRDFVQGVKRIFPPDDHKNGNNGFDPTGQQSNSESKSPGNRSNEHKNKQNTRSTDPADDSEDPKMLDDLDGLELDDLDIEDLEDDTIPSEETDPEWLKEERRKKRRRRGF